MKQFSLTLLALALALISHGQDSTETEVSNPKVQVSFVYPIGTGGYNSIHETYNVSLSLLAGASAGIEGLELAGFASFTNGTVEGAQLSGFANVVKDSLQGFQAAGFANLTNGALDGVQAAGFSNVLLSQVNGAQIAGFANYALDSVRGAQLGGFANVSTGFLTGVQVAGFANYATGTRGTQIAGFANVNVGRLKGNQLAGFANVSSQELEGAQIAGFINVAKKVTGAQLGFINIADTLHGAAVGFLSYSRNGYHQFELSANETFQTNLAFKTGTIHFYNIFSTGVHWDKDNPVWVAGYGIGTRKEFKQAYAMNLELSSHSVIPSDFRGNEWESFNKLQLSVARSLGSELEVFAGASINMWISENEEPQNDYLYARKYSGNNGQIHWILYPGFQFGIRI